MSDLIAFIRSYRQTRRFGLPLMWSIKAAWHWRKLSPELIQMIKTYRSARKGETP